jgi:S-DNA-T family DNA segregation ATPase FtsK/SpoIIIE
MAKRKKAAKNKRSKKEKEEEYEEEEGGILTTVSPQTIRGVSGVALVVFALILLLSGLGMAGVAGEKLHNGIYYIVGIGYWVIPALLVGWAWSLFTTSFEERALQPVRTVGAVLFFISLLAIVGVLANAGAAGVLGALLAKPMLLYLDVAATLVLLFGLFVISLLLMFDAELWLSLIRKVTALVKKDEGERAEDEELLDEDAELEEEVDEGDEEADEVPEDEEEELDDEDYELGEEEMEPTPRKKKKASETYALPSDYVTPPLSLLEEDRKKANAGDTKVKANIIRKTLSTFKIPVEMDEVIVGPTVTRYSLKPAAGVKLNKITALQPNLELALAASPIRIEAPIPGKSLVGIEVPNTGKSIVGLQGLLASPEFSEETVPLFITLGKDIAGNVQYANIGKMPHLLVAGTTGSGKSVMIHAIVASLLYRNGPERLKFIMIDPKRVELSLYNDIPHLLTPVITDAKKCILSLKWAAKEMDRRYEVIEEHRLANIDDYHKEIVSPVHKKYEKYSKEELAEENVTLPEPLPHIVVIIDELSDIMQAYPRELESAIVRLAQKSRAVGIHLILSTQRPSANVITGLIKANIPTRIALKVTSVLESRIILDQPGAEKLLGAGDMLYLSADMAKPRRLQSPFLTTKEAKKLVAFLHKHNEGELHDTTVVLGDAVADEGGGIAFDQLEDDDECDDLYEEIREFVVQQGKASTSLIQRRFKVGYGRAARIMDQLEQRSVIAPADGNKPRRVLAAEDGPDGEEDEYDEEAYDR